MQHNPVFERFEQAPPGINEEYFEWIDLLMAVEEAGQRNQGFTMAELGAGHGRWGIARAKAATALGMRAHITFVEAEPQHCLLLQRDVLLQFPGRHYEAETLGAAIAYGAETVPFYIRKAGFDSSNWFGQYRCTHVDGVPTDRIYHGHVVFQSARYADEEYIEVPAITLAEAIQRLPVVDLVDMDLQGAELDVVQHDMGTLLAKVRKVHIGTHGPGIEDFLRARFIENGWVNVWDFAAAATHETPYGSVYFQDGVQTWLNPRL